MVVIKELKWKSCFSVERNDKQLKLRIKSLFSAEEKIKDLLTREAHSAPICKVHSLNKKTQLFRGTAKPDTNLAQTAVLNQVAQTEQVSTVVEQLKLKINRRMQNLFKETSSRREGE